MGIQDIAQAGRAMMMLHSSEGATLLHKASRIDITGIYFITQGGASPLDGRTTRPGVYFHCLLADAVGVEPGWQIDVRGAILPVIAAVPDGAGFMELYLGDPND